MMAANDQWLYRGEGNINIVLADTKEKNVYRFVKTKIKPEKYLEDNNVRADEIRFKLQKIVDYVKEVMKPLLSSSYVIAPLLEEIPSGFAETLNEAVKEARPAHRKGKDIDFAARSALVLPDFCYVFKPNCLSIPQSLLSVRCQSTISIEIKPKTGFLPTSKHIKHPIKLKVCKFCMSSRLKGKRMWLKPSSYCPLDLFSGKRSRVRHAIHALLDTPQNNLKICKDGEEVYSEYVKEDLIKVLENFLGKQAHTDENANKKNSIDVFIDLVVDALHCPMNSWSPVQNGPNKGRDQNQHCSNSSYVETTKNEKFNFPSGCILEKILSVQYLDDLDIEGIYPLYEQLQNHFLKCPQDRQKFCMDGPYKGDAWCVVSNNNNIESANKNDILYAMIKVKQFLVAQTVKDCSIILAMQRQDERPEKSAEPYLVDSFGHYYKHSLAIIDLDPKPFDKIPLYQKHDAAMISTCQKLQFPAS
ncbi:IPPK [Acanthosepion pharaonis]|uniref:Inositol-pentakisphosphate 2-kinase n=1 Tax=Acanthosepion pharaonis TaxID=158019 RepID=A0A812DLG2_ACAPH|nr:IPPK [Sepia pharaonis]